jgi:hypothetical protein
LYDLPVLHRQMLEVLGIKNYQKLVPIEDDMKPRDPVTENMNMLKGKPVKAFLYQDHQAHITVHMAMAQEPKIQELLGQNPQMAQKLMAVGSAHIAEHLGMEMRKQMEQAMGQTLPAYEDDADEQMMSPEMEVRVSQMAAQAAQQLLQQSQQAAQQKKNQQMANDPLIQLQQQELQIKGQDLQRKAAKDRSDAQLKQEQINIERARIEAQQQTEGAKLMAKTYADRDKTKSQKESEGFRIMSDIHRAEMQMAAQRENSQRQSQPKKKGE